MKPRFILPAVLLAFAAGALPAGAALLTWEWTDLNLEVPDAPFLGDPTTVSDTRTVHTGFPQGFTQIQDISVQIEIVGSDGAGGSGTMWNGDLNVRLIHESGVSVVLMNRVGRTGSNPFGASGNGVDVHFDGAALQDIHLEAGSVALSGTYQPDGRTATPSTVTNLSARDATFADALDAFRAVNASPDGLWTLSVTDFESGGLARVASWGLTIIAEPVPEPGATAMASATALAGAMLVREACRRRR